MSLRVSSCAAFCTAKYWLGLKKSRRRVTLKPGPYALPSLRADRFGQSITYYYLEWNGVQYASSSGAICHAPCAPTAWAATSDYTEISPISMDSQNRRSTAIWTVGTWPRGAPYHIAQHAQTTTTYVDCAPVGWFTTLMLGPPVACIVTIEPISA